MGNKSYDKDDFITRRDVVFGLAFLAANLLSVTKRNELFAQISPKLRKPINWDKLRKIKPVDPDARALKVLIFNDPEIYRSEYAHFPPQLKPDPSLTCKVNYAVLRAKRVGCQSESCTNNNCGSQSCGTLNSCETNRCTDQNCSELQYCLNKNVGMLSPMITWRSKNDPFINALFTELNITTDEQLRNSIRGLISQIKSK